MSGRRGSLAVAVSGRGLVEPGEPVLAADDEGFTRGRAAFETMRVYGGRPFRFAQHVARLAQLGGADRPRAARRAPRSSAWLRSRSSRRRLPRRCCGSTGRRARRAASTARSPSSAPIPDWIEEARARGQRLVSLLHQRRSAPWLLPATKSTSYAVSIAAEAEAKARGADDAIFVDGDGIVLEGPVTNIWWREGDVLLTPSLEVGILAGETRAALLELAARSGPGGRGGRLPARAAARGRRGLHLLVDPGGDARGRGRRPPVPARPGRGGAAGGAPRRGARAERRGAAGLTPSERAPAAVDDEVRAADGVVALDVAVLGRHPDVGPRAPRLLAVARDAPGEPHVVRRLDPDPHRVGVAERAVERADTLHDDDAARLDRPRSRGARRPPSRTTRSGPARPLESGVTTSRCEPLDVEALAVPELVGRDDLRAGDHPRERRLPGRAVPADPDQDDAGRRRVAAASISSSTGRGVHRRTVPSAHGEAAARRHGALERRPRARPDLVGCGGARRRTARSARLPAPSGASRRT